jgi:hypothetical protein
MNVQVQPHVTTTQRHLPFECVPSCNVGLWRKPKFERLTNIRWQQTCYVPNSNLAGRLDIARRQRHPTAMRTNK